MSTDLSWRQPFRHGLTALVEKWEQSSSTARAEFLVVGITGPTLVVLVVLLGIARGLPLLWSQVLATILGLVPAIVFMQRETRSCIQTGTDAIPSTAQTSRVVVATNCCGEVDYEGWYGQMVNLTSDELEFLSERLGEYLEGNDDLNHTEFGFAKGLLDKIDEALA